MAHTNTYQNLPSQVSESRDSLFDHCLPSSPRHSPSSGGTPLSQRRTYVTAGTEGGGLALRELNENVTTDGIVTFPKSRLSRDLSDEEIDRIPRKIVIDSGQTRLTNEHMKAMLHDTSDLVLPNVPYLTSWPRDDIEDDADGYVGVCQALQKLSTEQLLARPCIGDDDGLAPELLNLWGRNMCKITGKAGTRLPFRMRSDNKKRKREAATTTVTIMRNRPTGLLDDDVVNDNEKDSVKKRKSSSDSLAHADQDEDTMRMVLPEEESETEGDSSRVELARGANDSFNSDRQLWVCWVFSKCCTSYLLRTNLKPASFSSTG